MATSTLELELGFTDGGTSKVILDPFNPSSPALTNIKNRIQAANTSAATLAADSTTWIGFTTNDSGAVINNAKAIVGATLTTKNTTKVGD